MVVDSEASSWAPVESGVPQGTVLGPLLFLLFINDLPAHVTSQVRLFANDCLLYRTLKSGVDQKTLQQDLKQLGLWASTWGMRFNPSKCVIMTITRVERKILHKLYTMEGVLLSHVQEVKCLGILISDDLSWSKHTQMVSFKANSITGLLRRNLHHCPVQLWEQAFISLVRSRLEYSATAWDPHLAKDIDQGPGDDPESRGQVCQAKVRHEEQRHQPPTRPTVGTTSATQMRTPSCSALQDYRWQGGHTGGRHPHPCRPSYPKEPPSNVQTLALTVRAVQTIILPRNAT